MNLKINVDSDFSFPNKLNNISVILSFSPVQNFDRNVLLISLYNLQKRLNQGPGRPQNCSAFRRIKRERMRKVMTAVSLVYLN